MSVITQEEPTGCGIASVANIAEVSYFEMKSKANSLGIYAEDETLYSDTRYVRTLLHEYNFETSEKEIPFTSWEELPETALLAIKHHEIDGKHFWHWVVFKRESGTPVVLDSASYLKNNKRSDFDKMQPKWFITVAMKT